MFTDILNSITKELEEKKLDLLKLISKINTLFQKIGMADLDEEDLMNTIGNLSEEDKLELEKVVKDKDTQKVASILGLEKI